MDEADKDPVHLGLVSTCHLNKISALGREEEGMLVDKN